MPKTNSPEGSIAGMDLLFTIENDGSTEHGDEYTGINENGKRIPKKNNSKGKQEKPAKIMSKEPVRHARATLRQAKMRVHEGDELPPEETEQ